MGLRGKFCRGREHSLSRVWDLGGNGHSGVGYFIFSGWGHVGLAGVGGGVGWGRVTLGSCSWGPLLRPGGVCSGQGSELRQSPRARGRDARPRGWGPHAPGTARSPSSPPPPTPPAASGSFGSSPSRCPSPSAPAKRRRVRLDCHPLPHPHSPLPNLATPGLSQSQGFPEWLEGALDFSLNG